MQLVARIVLWLENVLFLQAVCVLVSSPILYFWKMPSSYFATLGNVIFAPFMGTFIFLGAMIFFCGLLGLYPKSLYIIFQKLVHVWSLFLKTGSTAWLFIPSLLTVFCWFVGVAGLMYLYRIRLWRSKTKRFLIFWLGTFSCCCVLQSFWAAKEQRLFKCGKSLHCVATERGIVLTDNGVFGKLAKPEKFVFYQLRPFLLEHFNNYTINKLILPKQSKRYVDAAQCCKKFLQCRQVVWSQEKMHTKSS